MFFKFFLKQKALENINGYEQIKELGKGSFGCVYLAQKNGQLVALKKFDNALFDTNVCMSYDTEWQKLSTIENDKGVTVLIDKFESNGCFFIVTEFCEV